MEIQQKPRILFVITQGAWGGAQRYVFDVAHACTDDFDVTVAVGEFDKKNDLQNKIDATNLHNQALEKTTNKKIKIKNLTYLTRPLSFWKDVQTIREVAHLYNELKPDVVCLNSSKAGVLGSLAKLLSTHKPKIVYTVHGWAFLEPGWFSKKIYYTAELLTSHLKDAFIVLSEREKKIAEHSLLIAKQKIHLIPHSAGALIFAPKETARAWLQKQVHTPPQNSELWIGTIASLYKTKGLHYLVDAALTIIKKNPNCHFIIVGEGTERSALEARIKQGGGTDNIHLIGFYHNAAHNLLKGFDIFVLPSLKEGDPYVIQEALQAGLPIIATAVGSIPERITDGKNGIVVPPGNSQALAQAIETLAQDKQKRDFLIANVLAAGQQTEKSFLNFITATKKLFFDLAPQPKK